MHTGSSARIIPNVAGYYEVSMGVWWAAGSTTSNQDQRASGQNGSQIMLLQETFQPQVLVFQWVEPKWSI
jgi:hypothetical protein